MSKFEDFALKDCIRAAVKVFGSDENMESAKTHDELREWIGDEGAEQVVQRLEDQ